MIYEEPIYKALGDCYVGVELGDEAGTDVGLRTLALGVLIEASAPRGVVEVCRTARQLGVVYDRRWTSYEAIVAVAREAYARLDEVEKIPSRRYVLPMWYGDPWTVATAKKSGERPNLEYVAELNGITEAEFIERHSAPDYLVVLVAFTPGTNLHYPLAEDYALSAPKVVNPRTILPGRTVGFAGIGTCQYPLASPGGYQMIGRLAIEVYQRMPNLRGMREDGVLLRAGDRVSYRPIDPDTYEEVREQIVRGEYEYEYEDGFVSPSGGVTS